MMEDDLMGVVVGALFMGVTAAIIFYSRYRSRIRVDFEEFHYDKGSSLVKEYMYALLSRQFDERIRHVEITADNYLELERADLTGTSDFSDLSYQDILDFWNDLTGESRKPRIGGSKCSTLVFTTQHGVRRVDSVVGKSDRLLGLWLKL